MALTALSTPPEIPTATFLRFTAYILPYLYLFYPSQQIILGSLLLRRFFYSKLTLPLLFVFQYLTFSLDTFFQQLFLALTKLIMKTWTVYRTLLPHEKIVAYITLFFLLLPLQHPA